MSWEREVLATSVDDLVTRNSPQPLAHQMQSACRT